MIGVQYVHYLQRKYALSSFNLLGHTAPAQAVTLLLFGPFLDYWLTSKRIDAFEYNLSSMVRLVQIYGLYIFLFIVATVQHVKPVELWTCSF